MQLNRKSAYALDLLAALGQGTRPSRMIDLLGPARIDIKDARRVLDRLSQAGLVRGRRGRTGGFVLTRPLDEVTLAQVLAAMEEEPCGDEGARSPVSRQIQQYLEAGTHAVLAATLDRFVGAPQST
jgi:Rrf2 family protein